MHPLQRLLRDWTRASAETIPAKVISKQADGNYLCALVDTGFQVLGTPSQPNADYTPGQLVLLVRTDSSGRTRNTPYIIIGPGTARNASGSPTATDAHTVKASAISFVNPDPCSMKAGSIVDINIYGSGFVAAPTYGDPNLKNVIAPTIIPTRITLQVRADPAIVPGDYALVLDDRRKERYFQISATTIPVNSLWEIGANNDYSQEFLLRLNPADMSLVQAFEVNPLDLINFVALVGTKLYIRMSTSMLRLDYPAGSSLATVATGLKLIGGFSEFPRVSGQYIYHGGLASADGFVIFDTVALTEAHHPGLGGSIITDVCPDGSIAWLTDRGYTRLIKWNVTGGSEVSHDNLSSNPSALDVDVTYIYVLTEDGIVTKIQKSDYTHVASTASQGSTTSNNTLRLSSGYLYGTASNKLFRIDPATMTVSSVDIGHGALGIAFSTAKLYVDDVDGGITIVDRTAFTIDSRMVLSGPPDMPPSVLAYT